MKVNKWLLPLRCHLGTMCPRDATRRLPCFILAAGWQNCPTEILFPSRDRDAPALGRESSQLYTQLRLFSGNTPWEGKPSLSCTFFQSMHYLGKPCCTAADALGSGLSAEEDGHIAPVMLKKSFWIWQERIWRIMKHLLASTRYFPVAGISNLGGGGELRTKRKKTPKPWSICIKGVWILRQWSRGSKLETTA